MQRFFDSKKSNLARKARSASVVISNRRRRLRRKLLLLHRAVFGEVTHGFTASEPLKD